MNYYAVTFLTADGGIDHRRVRAYFRAAAENTVASIWGGSFHTATLETS